jgi:hypothetical protein
VDHALPFAAGSVRAIAIASDLMSGARIESRALIESAARALRARGRLVGPATAPVPDGVVELARDAEDWVAEKIAVASPPVALRSARR